MNKQKYLLEILVSSGDVFSRCVGIIKPEYFDGDLRRVLRFVLDYFEKYRRTPDLSTIMAEHPDVVLSDNKITTDKVAYACDELEKYCRESAVAIAMSESVMDLDSGNLGLIVERMQKAVSVSLRRDLGWDLFGEDFIKRLMEALASQKTHSTGIEVLDKYLSGGLARQQTTLFTANSGSGKSVMLNNLAYNYAAQGMHSVILSLELPKNMIFTRSSAITSGFAIKTIGEHVSEVASTINSIRENISGSLTIQRLAGDSTANNIRSYLTQYEMELGHKPDFLAVDYLDKMTPNQGVGNLSLSEQDKAKAYQLSELVYDWNLICASASQQNREAIKNASPKQDVIAGGLTKINEVDNVISLYMDDQMRTRGEMLAFFLKTRSSDGVGKSTEMHFDEANLRITDPGKASNNGLFDIRAKTVDYVSQMKRDLPGLKVSDDVEYKNKGNLLDFMEKLDDE